MFCLATSLAHVLIMPTEAIQFPPFFTLKRKRIGRRISGIMDFRSPIEIEDKLHGNSGWWISETENHRK